MTYEIVSERKIEYNQIMSPRDIFELCNKMIKSKTKQEHFIVITLNGAHIPISAQIVSIGITNRTIVHPREVFRKAIVENASAIIVAHNHPSGNLEPSSEDRDITSRLKKAGEIVGIQLLDHVVFSKTSFYSFQETGSL